MAGEVDAVVAGLEHVPVDDVVDLLGRHAGALEGCLRGGDREVLRVDVLEGAALGAEGRADGGQEDDLAGLDVEHGALLER